MVDRKTVLEALERIAPVHIAESWDNCGMQIDLGFDEIGKILVCLEIILRRFQVFLRLGLPDIGVERFRAQADLGLAVRGRVGGVYDSVFKVHFFAENFVHTVPP